MVTQTTVRQVTLGGLVLLALVPSILYVRTLLPALFFSGPALPLQSLTAAGANAGNANLNVTINVNVNLKKNKTAHVRAEVPLQLPPKDAGAGAGALNINIKLLETETGTGIESKTKAEAEAETRTRTRTDTKTETKTETGTESAGTLTAAPPALQPPYGGHKVRATPTMMSLMSSFKTCGMCQANGTGDFIRVGAWGDGGYVLCKGPLAGARGVISIGVRGYDPLSNQLAETYGIPVHTFDCYSGATKCPKHYQNCSLVTHHRKCIGRGRDQLSLPEVLGLYFPGDRRDIILKIDCEGCEWETLADVGAETLARFLTVAIEWHDLERAGKHALMLRTQQQLLETFQLVHTHGCNCIKSVFMWEQEVLYWMPSVVEGLLVPKDLALPLSSCLQTEYVPEVDRPVCGRKREYFADAFHIP